MIYKSLQKNLISLNKAFKPDLQSYTILEIMRKMNQRGFAPILVIIAILIAVGAGAYYLGTQKPKESTSLPQTPQATPTPTIKESNWKSYSDKNLKVSFEYPPDWREKSGTGVGNVCFASPDIEGKNEGIGGGFDIKRGMLICFSYLGPEEKTEDYRKTVCNNKGQIKGTGQNTCNEGTFNGTKSLSMERDYGRDYLHTSYNLEERGFKVVIVEFHSENTRIIQDIISTIKFIQ